MYVKLSTKDAQCYHGNSIDREHCAKYLHKMSTATTCTGAGLHPGCCEGNCTVNYDGGRCYCDKMCREQGDCCTDVDLTSQCETPACTLTISKYTMYNTL